MTVTETKEHPILFSADMIRALLNGSKTQTRRPLKGVNGAGELDYDFRDFPLAALDRVWFDGKNGEAVFECQIAVDDTSDYRVRCPFGKPGDRLWVRETWREKAWSKADFTKAGLSERPYVDSGIDYYGETLKAVFRADGDHQYFRPWKPNIHMPRWASRLTLHITDIRIEQIQDITEEDAAAEGVRWGTYEPHECRVCARGAFMDLWDTIYESRGYGWSVNPWCWIVEFERCPSISIR